MDFDVYLINANFSLSRKYSACDNQGLIAIHNGLESEGIKSHLLPEEFIESRPQIEAFLSKGNMLGDVLDKIDNDGTKVIGLSAWTQAYPFLENIACSLRERLSDAYLIAGGSHFTPYEETKDEFLKSPLDAYALGGSAFVKFCTGARDGEIILEDGMISGNVPKGFYYRSNGTVLGKGRSGYPKINLTKIDAAIYCKTIVDGVERIGISLPSSNKCLNGCDYCSSPKNGIDSDFLVQYMNAVLKDPSVHGKNILVGFEGNNPFMAENRKGTERLLSAVIESGENAECGFFLDPSLLVGENYRYMLDTVLKYDFPLAFFIGRDTIREKNSRKWYGVPRTQKRLDSEIEGIITFMNGANQKKKQTDIVISYIAFPEDGADTYKSTASEMIRLALVEKELDSVGLEFHSNILTPFPGTVVRRKNRGKIKSDIPWGLYSIGTNVWKDTPLLDHMQNAKDIRVLCDENNLLKNEEKHALDIAMFLYPYILDDLGMAPREGLGSYDLRAFGLIAKKASELIKELSEEQVQSSDIKELIESRLSH